MRRGQVLVRALKADGKWGNVDVLDLDDVSFRAFVLDRLVLLGGVISLVDDYSGEKIILKEKTNESGSSRS